MIRKNFGKTLAVSVLLAAVFLVQGMMNVYGAGKPERLTSATYCSDAWVINFWNSESSRMEEELRQIKADGFNSIVLAVPWREFQPTANPVSYNPYAWEKLHRVMKTAQQEDLWVVLRVGYTWDYYSTESILPRYEALMYADGGTGEAWLAYTGKLYQEMSAYPNFYGGFLTWEDFWNFTDKAGSAGKGAASVRLAKQIGYQDYLEQNYTLELAGQIYQQEFSGFDKLYLPERTDHAYLLFYAFYDDFLNRLLRETQTVFPGISMEVRLDVDPVNSEDGQSEIGVPHYGTYACGDSAFTSAMYGVSMGHGFGKALEAGETLETMKQQLAIMRSYNGGKPIYLDQFLYMDTTEEFAHNSQLKPEERNKFLIEAAPVLRSMTMGYGIWTYRNYTDNAVYNHQFGLGGSGWKLEGGCQIEEHGGSMAAVLGNPKAVLTQDLTARVNSRSKPIQVRLRVDSESPTDITVTLGGVAKTVTVDGPKQIELNFGKISGSAISFRTSGKVWVDDVNVYSYIQDGQLYGLDGGELSCIGALRAVNRAVAE